MNENGQEMELIRSMTAVEIKPETAREELSSRNYSKVPLSRITALGVGFEPLTAALQQVLSGGEAVSGIYRVTILAGTHLAQFKGSTDFLGAALGAGRIEAQARLNPLIFSPAAVGTLLMAATLANIDKKLDAIQETQQEMLDFLKAKERSALMGGLEFLADVFNNYKYIKSQLLQAAVDVNVHPAKTEVKFSDEKRVFDAVHYAILGALEQRRQPGEALVPDVPATLEPTEAEDKNIEPSPAKLAPIPDTTKVGWGYAPFRTPPSKPNRPQGRENYTTSYLSPGLYKGDTAQEARGIPREEPPGLFASGPSPAPDGTEPQKTALDEPVRVIGEALGLYILAEWNGMLVIIDKHAAHERMLYDRFRCGEASCMSQRLLEPRPFTLGAVSADVLQDELEFISSLGFEVEPYGRQSFVLRATPEGIEPDEAVALIEEAVDRFSGSRRQDSFSIRDELLKDVACKAAIKAGKRSEPEELQALAEAVCSGALRYCPHGRPVSWALSRKDLDKEFKRIL